MSLLQEVHHRVKNNLQIIASIMRMQARRAEHRRRALLLEESVNRIMSVAVVHEFLSQNAKGTINLEDVAHRILGQVQQGLIAPSKQIVLRVQGPSIWLPAEQATQCALVINELVQNAIEHGMASQSRGSIGVELVDHGEKASIIVTDDGEGLPDGFDLTMHANLGLRIVSSMVERDLGGTFCITQVGRSYPSGHPVFESSRTEVPNWSAFALSSPTMNQSSAWTCGRCSAIWAIWWWERPATAAAP